MIKKLRRNIILINMLFVGIVIIAIFATVCFNSYNTSINNIEHGLNQVIEKNPSPATNDELHPPINEIGKLDKENDMIKINGYIVVEIDNDGNILTRQENNATIDEDVLNDCINKILGIEAPNGQINEYGLMFVKNNNMNSQVIALADTSSVYTSLFDSILICLGLFVGSMIVIFLISLALSGLAVKPVKEAWTKQKQFVADASHELKTPLTVILANNNIMKSHTNSKVEDEQKWLESTEEEANHMKQLIDQMLFLAKSDAGNTQPELSEVDISEIIEGASLNFEPIAFENDIEIETNVEENIKIMGNSTQLNQLAHILIDNAVKYAEKKSVVRINLQHKNEVVEFSVNNIGNVIGKEELNHIFDRFYRAEKSRTTKGYGLGLSIAQSIVQNMNGKLSVESNKEDGTTFTAHFKKK